MLAIVLLIIIIAIIATIKQSGLVVKLVEPFQRFIYFRGWGNPLVKTKGLRKYQFGKLLKSNYPAPGRTQYGLNGKNINQGSDGGTPIQLGNGMQLGNGVGPVNAMESYTPRIPGSV